MNATRPATAIPMDADGRALCFSIRKLDE